MRNTTVRRSDGTNFRVSASRAERMIAAGVAFVIADGELQISRSPGRPEPGKPDMSLVMGQRVICGAAAGIPYLRALVDFWRPGTARNQKRN
jgi:hypothetical protein